MRVIPTCILGGAVTGALVALFHCELVTPHGGVFVLLIPNAINHAWLYLAAIAAGSIVTGVSYAIIKKNQEEKLLTNSYLKRENINSPFYYYFYLLICTARAIICSGIS